MESYHYRNLLNCGEQRIYDAILKSWKKKENDCRLDYCAIGDQQFNSIVQYILLDHPEIFYINEKTIRILIAHTTVHVHTEFIYGIDAIVRIEKKLSALQNHVAASVLTQTDADKYKLIHGIILKKVRYVEGQPIEQDHHNIIGPLMDHLAVCDGFAKMLKVLCDCVGLPCIIVRGKAVSQHSSIPSGHAWNIILIDKHWVHCDITWDSLSSWEDVASYAYSFLPDHIICTDHSWDISLVPQCTPIPISSLHLMIPCIRGDRLKEIVSYIMQGSSSICIRVIHRTANNDIKCLLKRLLVSTQSKIIQYIFIDSTSTLLVYLKEKI